MMVKLTVDMITRGTSGYNKKKRDEGTDSFLRRLTHLYLEDKNLDELGEELTMCKSLSVLYLYDNKIGAIPDLSQNHSITHLYLQNNLVERMSNLNQLRKLSKLYLGGNKLHVLEGLDHLERLEELHIENQDLAAGEKLLIDPRSLHAISRSLRVLNISGNNLDSMKQLAIVPDLTQLICSNNRLTDMKELSFLLSGWFRLTHLELNGNPICQKSKYRDRTIVMSNSLRFLDGKEITQTSRQFLQNWKASKDAQRRKLLEDNSNYSDAMSATQPSESSEPVSRQMNKISSYVMPGLPRKQFDEVLARSAATVPSSVPYSAPVSRKPANVSFPPSFPINNSYDQSYLPPEYGGIQTAVPRARTSQVPSTINF